MFKHVILSLFFSIVNQKENPYTFFDTHAGEGVYDYTLFLKRFAHKHVESEQGIQNLWRDRQVLPLSLRPFLDCLNAVQVQPVNASSVLTRYPGSAYLMSYFARDHDQLIFNEVNPAAHQALKRWFYHDKRIHLHQRDAYECLGGLLPPRTKQAYVFIDPPYENKQEWHAMTRWVSNSLMRFRQGRYLIWYPLTRTQMTLPVLPALKAVLKQHEHVIIECIPAYSAGTKGLIGSGMLLIHPPYGLIEACRDCLPWLVNCLSSSKVNQPGLFRCYTVSE